jgi:uncharacterized protein
LKLLDKVKQIPTRLALSFIWLYRNLISPLFPPTCRFYPTCSRYSAEALKKHGFIKGAWLTVIRILKCQPFYHGNTIDLVPPHKHGKSDLDG